MPPPTIEQASQKVLDQQPRRNTLEKHRPGNVVTWGIDHLGPTAAGMAVKLFMGGATPADAAFYGAVRAGVARSIEVSRGLDQVMTTDHVKESGFWAASKQVEVWGGQVAVGMVNAFGEKVIGGLKKEYCRPDLYKFMEFTSNAMGSGVLRPPMVAEHIKARMGGVDVFALMTAGNWGAIDYANLEVAAREMSKFIKTLAHDQELGAFAERNDLPQIYKGMERNELRKRNDLLLAEMVKKNRELIVALKDHGPAGLGGAPGSIQKAAELTQIVASANRGRLNKFGLSVAYVAGGALVGAAKGVSGFYLAEAIMDNTNHWAIQVVADEAKKVGKIGVDAAHGAWDSLQRWGNTEFTRDLWDTISGWWVGPLSRHLPLPLNPNGAIASPNLAPNPNIPGIVDTAKGTAGHVVRQVVHDGEIWGEAGAKRVWGPLSEASIDHQNVNAAEWKEYWDASFDVASKSPNHSTLRALLENGAGDLKGASVQDIMDRVSSPANPLNSADLKALWEGLDPKKLELLVQTATADPEAGKFTAVDIRKAVVELQALWGQLPPGDKYANLIEETLRKVI